MLLLSRKVKEQIIIGNDIIVTVASIKGNQVKIGISAPPDISIHRKEIFLKIKKDKESKQ